MCGFNCKPTSPYICVCVRHTYISLSISLLSLSLYIHIYTHIYTFYFYICICMLLYIIVLVNINNAHYLWNTLTFPPHRLLVCLLMYVYSQRFINAFKVAGTVMEFKNKRWIQRVCDFKILYSWYSHRSTQLQHNGAGAVIKVCVTWNDITKKAVGGRCRVRGSW